MCNILGSSNRHVGVHTNFVSILSLTYYTPNLTSIRRVTAVSSLITLAESLKHAKTTGLIKAVDSLC